METFTITRWLSCTNSAAHTLFFFLVYCEFELRSLHTTYYCCGKRAITATIRPQQLEDVTYAAKDKAHWNTWWCIFFSCRQRPHQLLWHHRVILVKKHDISPSETVILARLSARYCITVGVRDCFIVWVKGAHSLFSLITQGPSPLYTHM